MPSPNAEDSLLARATAPGAAVERPLRRSFLTGKLLDPELHPRLRTRVARALRSR